uniref:NADH dehydrogenase subunit 3 n=1 Tax=Parasacculina shiinoi TaxID=2836419 RepID=UPI002551D3E8|nr:NADH dehydrogenase subunit 3 [Parasacculina shiinoi]WGU20877.1 NADH dehydrogenase subunit 3 [Parasacculina shiinoi]
MIFILLIFFLVFFLYLVSLFICSGFLYYSDGCYSFECGYVSKFSSRLVFSIHFYVFMLVFLIFDAEVVFVIPFISLSFSIISFFFYFFVFMFLVIFSLWYEWYDGSLFWVY